MSKSEPLYKLLQRAGVLNDIPSESETSPRKEGPIFLLSLLKLVDELTAIEAITKTLGIAHYDLYDPGVVAQITPEAFVGKVDPEICRTNKLIPIANDNNSCVVAFANPLDTDAMQTIEFALGKRVIPVIATETQIAKLLNEHYQSNNVHYDSLGDVNEDAVEIVGAIRDDQDIDDINPDTPPIIKLVNKIIADAIHTNASDIHVEPTSNGLDIRFRIDGVMQHIFDIPKRLQPYVISRIKILAGMDIAVKRTPQDGRLRVRITGKTTDLRVSSVPASYGEKVVLRILRSSDNELNFSSIGFPPQMTQRLSHALLQRAKMVLVTGPTGSGKTTTLYTCLSHIKDGTTNIETVEDPIEFRIPGVSQIQVCEAADVTFASALRSILRQDPDVIMVGEIRDEETADMALQAAQTGHLVISTLHTNDAISAITRLMNLECPSYLIASSLAAVIAQRLVRKICVHCTTPAPADYLAIHYEMIKKYNINPATLRVGHTCAKCNFTGYHGRTALYSYLDITEAIAELISTSASPAAIAQIASKQGYKPLDIAAVELLTSGTTTLDEIKHHLQFQPIADEQLIPVSPVPVQPPPVIAPPEIITPQPAPSLDKTSPKNTSIYKETILLVEDDADLRFLTKATLEHEMFNVVEAENGLDALEEVYKHPPDLILLDLMMPVMNGKEFLVRIKNNKQTKDIPVIILTAANTEEKEVDLLSLGARDFVAKTSSKAILITRIRNILNNS